MVLVHYILRSDVFLHRPDGNGYAVLVAAADKLHITSLRTLVAYVDIGRQIAACQVSYMNRSVGIRQCRGDQDSLIIFSHNLVTVSKSRN